MNMQLQKVLIFLLVVCFLPREGVGQYHLERIFKNELKTASIEEIARFRKAPLVIIKPDLPVFKQKRKKSAEVIKYEAGMTKAIRIYNEIVDSVTLKYYPFNKEVIVKSESAAEKLFKNSKSKKEYAVMSLRGDDSVLFKLSSQRKGLYVVGIPPDSTGVFEPSEVNFSFCFQRLENYFKRLEAGSSYSMKVHRKLMAELQERLADDLPSKTLLIDKKDLDEELTESNISKYYTNKFALVDKSFIDSIILSKDSNFYYLRVIPFTGLSSRNRGPGVSYSSSFFDAYHYIIDPTDGAALFFRWNMKNKITPYTLKKYRKELTKADR